MFFFCDKAQAQNEESEELSKINLYLDLGGGFSRGLTSLNIEGKIFTSKNLTWYARGGFGGGGVDNTEGPGGLAALTMLTGKGKHHFEANAGLFIGRYSDFVTEIFYLPIFDLGYRYQKPEGGLIFMAKTGLLGFRLGLGYAF